MIIFLYGQDTFRSTRKLKEIREKFHHELDPTRTNEHVFDALNKNVSFEDIHSAITSFGFFSSKRLVILKNIFSTKTLLKDITKYLSSAPPLGEVIIVFWETGTPDARSGLFKRLINEKYAQEFPFLKGVPLVSWIEREAREKGNEINKEIAILLAQTYPEDMWRLKNELEKLIAFSNGKKITKELIKDFPLGTFNINIFDFVDCLGGKNSQQLATLLCHILETENELYILSMIHRQFRLLYQAKRQKKTLRSSQELAKTLHVHPYVAKKIWQQSEYISLRDIKQGLDKTVRAQLDIKTGRATPALALQLALFGV